MMGTQRVKFTFMTQLVKEPIIYQLGQNFNLVTNIRRADVREDMGWVVLDLDGDETESQRGLDWVSASGVRVDPVSGDVIEG